MKYYTEILGHEVEVDFDYRITESGEPSSWDDPGSPMEFEVTDFGAKFLLAPNHKLTLSRFKKDRILEEIQSSDRVYNDISEQDEYNHERDW